MKNFKNWLVALVLISSTVMFGQTTLTGTVVDDSNQPLPGASVVVKGTTNGVSTDFDGNFTLTAKATSGSVLVSFVGYNTKTVKFNGTKNIGSIMLSPNSEFLDEIVITQTSFAIDRKTPVAVSTIKASEIENKLGTQEFPEILKSTPGVYATKGGGGYGDSRINLRGFNSENVAVLINGVPVNDMENGRVYWSNWAGLSDVTSAMQVQRGLGASKVAVPSVGGTINILSKSSDMEKGGNIKTSIGNDGYQKVGFTLSTGLMDNGYAATVSASRTTGEGYIDGTQFSGVNYFVNVSKVFNENHKLSFTSFGSPQTHGQRQNKSLISKYRSAESGLKFNPDWGYKNGKVTHIEDNFYHKSQTSLNHYWTINDRSNLSTVAYVSFGKGGGGGEAGDSTLFDVRLGGDDQPVDLDYIVDINRSAKEAQAYLRASRNDHNWYGILSTYKLELTDAIDLIAGVDLRSYTGMHFSEVTDLLGADYALDDNDINNPNSALKVGDKRDYHNEGKVGWQGVFAQLEYDQDQISAFLSVAGSNTSYTRIDYFNYLDSDSLQETDKYSFLGYSAKGGANYRIDDTHNIFANIGYFEKAPIFGAVFQNYDNEHVNEDAENEKIFSVELGYGYRSEKFAANLNIYRTQWKDRSFTDSFTEDDVSYFVNLLGVNALHQGVEIDFSYYPSDKLSFRGMVSLGDWTWQNNIENVQIYDEAQNAVGDPYSLYIKDLKVSDAAQTTAAISVNYKILESTSLSLDYNYYDNFYADYEPNDRADATDIAQSWKTPSYGLVDASLVHNFKIGDFDTVLIARMNNVFNTEYITDATDGGNHMADEALVWFGFGRTFSLGAKFKF